jgi:hypothetical protein
MVLQSSNSQNFTIDPTSSVGNLVRGGQRAVELKFTLLLF